jgi:glutathione S-transferase
MYTLYWSTGCGSFAPHAALNEVGAQFNLIEVDLELNQHHTPEFLALNPRAQVPVLQF